MSHHRTAAEPAGFYRRRAGDVPRKTVVRVVRGRIWSGRRSELYPGNPGTPDFPPAAAIAMPSPHGSAPHPGARPSGASRFAGQYVRFELAGQHYACRIERIREIVIPDRITTIPEVPAYVLGVSNLRGAIIPVVDLRILLGLPGKAADADTRTIVITVGTRVMGCVVDAVSQVVRIPADDVRPPPDSAALGGPRFIEGFARLGDDLLILLDSDQLLSPDNLDAVHRASRIDHDTAGDA